jgi:hypothetical protein
MRSFNRLKSHLEAHPMRCRFALISLYSCLVFMSAFAMAGGQSASRPADENNVPVKQVVLFSSGVGYFEHTGKVHADGQTTLHFKTDQINDILKSLVLEDLDGGKVGAVSYPNPAPIDRTLRSFQVDITDNPSLAQLLTQLRGTKVSVSTMGGMREGVILGVEKRRRVINDRQIIDENVLNLRYGASVRSIELDQIQSLDMEDSKLNKELDSALLELAQSRDQDKKPVEIRFNGQGDRRVRIGYVVETPIWKTSYRLVFDSRATAQKEAGAPAPGGKIQGWAIVENQTDTDWTNVDLSLISGRPVSFIQDLYHSLYVPRPFVTSQVYASLTPQTYENGITAADLQKIQQKAANPPPVNQLHVAVGQGGGGGQTQVSNQLFQNANQLAAPPMIDSAPIDPIASVVSAATATGLGELFQYNVGDVSIKRQQSAMIPIVTDDIDIKKVSIYNRSVLATHPLNGIRLKNTTKKHLLAGPVTVIEAGSYAGDAQMDDVPPDQRRWLSYGIDLKTSVLVTESPQPSSIQLANVVRGVLHLQWKDVSQTQYVFTNHAGKDRTLVLEHPADPRWTLAEPATPDEKTASLYRFVRVVPADKSLQLTVRTELIRHDQIEILPLETENLQLYIKIQNIPPAIRDALAQIIGMKQAMATTQQQLEARRHQISGINAEQSRIRENMKAVAQTTDYYARLIKKLDEQETQIEQLQKEADSLAKQLETQRKDLESQASRMTLG